MYHLKSLSYTNVGFVKLMLVSNQLINVISKVHVILRFLKLNEWEARPYVIVSFLLEETNPMLLSTLIMVLHHLQVGHFYM